jgi:tetratricopeptide (TPR) repeat protein
VKLNAIGLCGALAVLASALMTGIAEARNPHCAGGIQYVVQAMKDKEKGNTDDYKREIAKAVQQLEMCSSEDPADYEAIGYLGWAYSEIATTVEPAAVPDNLAKAGKAFDAAIKGLQSKGDVKKVEMVTNNRNSYWAQAYNSGLGKINSAQALFPEYCKTPADDAEKTAKAEAEKNFREAVASLSGALALRPGDVPTMRNLATVYAMTCEFPKAEALLQEGLKAAPNDTGLTAALYAVRINVANKLADEKKYDEAITAFEGMLKTDANSASIHSALADVYFNRAQTLKDEARKKDFTAAGDHYAKAAELKANDADLTFNAAISYQNAQLWDKADPMWSKTVQIRPNDTDALSSWGAALVELKKCPDAITRVHKAVEIKPQDKSLHRQLGSIYTRCGNNSRGTDELMVYLAMQNGKPAADAATQAKAAKQGSDAAKTLAADGVPEAVYQWEADNQKFETWFYWGKKKAIAFSDAGAITRKSDWSAPDTKTAGK